MGKNGGGSDGMENSLGIGCGKGPGRPKPPGLCSGFTFGEESRTAGQVLRVWANDTGLTLQAGLQYCSSAVLLFFAEEMFRVV
jgi:hypothetical protein